MDKSELREKVIEVMLTAYWEKWSEGAGVSANRASARDCIIAALDACDAYRRIAAAGDITQPKEPPKKPLRGHPLQELTPANDAALQESVYDCYQGGPPKPRPFYQTPPGGEPVIPHEPRRMTRPVRLQLSRRRGFSLQEHSRAINGLEAVNCARPSKWGNPFRITGKLTNEQISKGHVPIETADYAISLYRNWLRLQPGLIGIGTEQLRGKNLACFCGLDEPCHTEILLSLANK